MGAPQKTGPGPAFIEKLGYVYIYQTPDNGTTWNFMLKLDPANDRVVKRRFGFSIALGSNPETNGTRLLIGAPGATGKNLTQPLAGVAFLYHNPPNTSIWELEVRTR